MPGLNQQSLKEKIGEQLFATLVQTAEEEVQAALASPKNVQSTNKYNSRWWLLSKLLKECEQFEDMQLPITPLDVVSVLFHAKLLFAAGSEQEYIQRTGGASTWDITFQFKWAEREKSIDQVIDAHLGMLGASVARRILVSEIKHVATGEGDASEFFTVLFFQKELPFALFLDDAYVVEKYKLIRPGLPSYSQSDAKRFFYAPSFGVTVTGSPGYVFLRGSALLRTFLSMLRIAAFIHKPQIDFGYQINDNLALTTPVIAGTDTAGEYYWDQHANHPWEKFPDGSLFLSDGYRGISKMWLDKRSFPGIDAFFSEHRSIFYNLNNPWKPDNVHELIPAIELLSTATQMLDLGAKFLLIYSALQHLFHANDNAANIAEGIRKLKPELLPWFENFNGARLLYMDKGYMVMDDEAMVLVYESMKNAFDLLAAKAKIHQ